MNQNHPAVARPASSVLSTNKVIRNTYTLLSMTLLFSALTAGIAVMTNMPPMNFIIVLAGYFGLLFATTKFANSSLGGTGAIFLGLSGYALTTRKDFSFMGGFLMVGILVAFLAGLGALIFSMPMLSLAVSAMFVLLMSGLILFQTSQIIHGGETNYILATVTLYISIYNLFTSLLHLLGAFSGDD